MPALDLSPVYARLAWARRRADELGAVVDAWTKAALDVREKHFDDERMIRFTACVADDPPDGVDLALGEVVYQSRAALDTLVGVLRGGATETSAFLVTPDRVAFEAALLPAKGKRREGRLFGLPDWAIDLFREIQPFEPLAPHPWGVFGAEARKLHDFAIVDRHHRIVVVATVAAIGYVETDRPEETVMRELGRCVEVEAPRAAEARPVFRPILFVDEPSIGPYIDLTDMTVLRIADRMIDAATRIVVEVARRAPAG